ncbi:CPBP family intramembrane glutamic endopeptidase [Hymenobacter fodinae]|nr:CPBP family intramembrane glutamic endopeptidase [Hymenobacter fodinae]
MKESWVALAWFALIMLLAAIPVFVIANHVIHRKSIVVSTIATVLGEVATIGFLMWYWKQRRVPLRLLGQVPPWIYLALPVIAFVQIILRSSLYYLHLPNWMENSFRQLEMQPWLAFLMLVVAAPILEEVLFRGILLNGLLRNYRPWVAIGQSALLFGVFHCNPVQTVSAGIMGLLLGWLFYRTQSLLLCIVLHALNNAVGLLGMLTHKANMVEPPHASAGSWVAYTILVVICGLLMAAFVLRVKQTTTPPALESDVDEAPALPEPEAILA